MRVMGIAGDLGGQCLINGTWRRFLNRAGWNRVKGAGKSFSIRIVSWQTGCTRVAASVGLREPWPDAASWIEKLV